MNSIMTRFVPASQRLGNKPTSHRLYHSPSFSCGQGLPTDPLTLCDGMFSLLSKLPIDPPEYLISEDPPMDSIVAGHGLCQWHVSRTSACRCIMTATARITTSWALRYSNLPPE